MQTWSWAFDRQDGGAAPVLKITIQPYAAPGSGRGWFDVAFAVSAPPFAGTVRSVWFTEDLARLAEAFVHLDREGEVVVGGHRAAELRLAGAAVVGAPDEVAVEAWLTENGDDPLPALSFAFYARRKELRDAATAMTTYVARFGDT
jgi:hypothetical protein